MKVETYTGRVIEKVSPERLLDPIHKGDFDPPLIPVVLPAVKTITRNGLGQLHDQWPSHQRGEKEVSH